MNRLIGVGSAGDVRCADRKQALDFRIDVHETDVHQSTPLRHHSIEYGRRS
jgi:hypothetical protein